jgi:biotin-dependent carboxylase-like uncharacterized protein
LDRAALDRANTLVANPAHAAALEVTLGGLVAVFLTDAVIAVTGARCPLLVDGVRREHAVAVGVPAGAQVQLGAASAGVRAYLAVAGGIAVDAVLGSRSTDTLAGLGPPRLRAGDTVPIGHLAPVAGPGIAGRAELDLVGVLAGSAARRVREPAIPSFPVLRVHPGPRADWFTPAALDVLCSAEWTVTPDADRVGARLSGPPLERTRNQELPSEGMIAGALQVPPASGPVLFLADHPVTGGYPVLATVDPADLWLAAQAMPGTRLRFTRVSGGNPGLPRRHWWKRGPTVEEDAAGPSAAPELQERECPP